MGKAAIKTRLDVGRGKILPVGLALHRSRKKLSNPLLSHLTTSENPPFSLKRRSAIFSCEVSVPVCTVAAPTGVAAPSGPRQSAVGSPKLPSPFSGVISKPFPPGCLLFSASSSLFSTFLLFWSLASFSPFPWSLDSLGTPTCPFSLCFLCLLRHLS